jgi:hypothetical protein
MLHLHRRPGAVCSFAAPGLSLRSKAMTFRIPITSDAVSYFASDRATPQLAIVQRTSIEGGEQTVDLTVYPDGGATLGRAFHVESVPHRDGPPDRHIPGLHWAWPDGNEEVR